jgi:hypothetical protein
VKAGKLGPEKRLADNLCTTEGELEPQRVHCKIPMWGHVYFTK